MKRIIRLLAASALGLASAAAFAHQGASAQHAPSRSGPDFSMSAADQVDAGVRVEHRAERSVAVPGLRLPSQGKLDQLLNHPRFHDASGHEYKDRLARPYHPAIDLHQRIDANLDRLARAEARGDFSRADRLKDRIVKQVAEMHRIHDKKLHRFKHKRQEFGLQERQYQREERRRFRYAEQSEQPSAREDFGRHFTHESFE